MRRLLAVILFCAGLFCIGQSDAFFQSRDSNYNISIASGGGGVTVDASRVFQTTTSTTSYNYTGITTTAAASAILICASADNVGNTYAAPVWDPGGVAQSFTLINAVNSASGLGRMEMWKLLTPGSFGNKTIAITFTGGISYVPEIEAISFAGANSFANYASAAGSGGTQSSLNVSVTSAANHVAAGCGVSQKFTASSVTMDNTTITTGSSSAGDLTGYNRAPGAASVTLTITPNVADYLAMSGVDVSP
jgi:hypothetical protein